MNHAAIRNEIRRRVVAATAINPVTDLKLEGQNYENGGKAFWVEEYLIGGALRAMTNCRSKVSSYLVQYDICCPVGTALDALEDKAAAVESALYDAAFVVGGIDCHVRQIKTSRAEGKLCNAIKVLLTVELNSSGG